jgi:lipoprotein NlpD
MRILGWAILVVMPLFFIACTLGESSYAPVLDANIESVPPAGVYRVQADDTLYSIAWRYGLDYQYLAKINHIAKPYRIEPRQLIQLRKIHGKRALHKVATPIKVSRNTSKNTVEIEPTANVSQWHWPSKGRVVNYFSLTNKGINIADDLGSPVKATAAGKVVYSGNGLRAYGNLIIIKHNSKYLSAYAHNRRILVKEGEWIKSGQKIAEMGNTGSREVLLHFEIRKEGKPINPMTYLTVRD